MHRTAGDQPWGDGPIRKSPNTYEILDDDLIVHRGQKPDVTIAMGEENDAITSLVKTLQDLTSFKDNRALTTYESGLFSYITRTLGHIYPLMQNKKWNRVASALNDYKSREEHDFQHDEDGRAEWKNWQKSKLVLAQYMCVLTFSGEGQATRAQITTPPSSLKGEAMKK